MSQVVTLVLCVSSGHVLTAEQGPEPPFAASPSCGAASIALGSTRRSARLLEADALAQALGGVPETAKSVRERIGELSQARPSLGGPIALLAVGAGLAIGGIPVALVGVESLLISSLSGLALGSVGTVLVIVGIVGIAIGVPLVVIGAVMLGKNLKERKALNRELETLNSRLRELSEAPPTRGDEGPRPTLTLASFS